MDFKSNPRLTGSLHSSEEEAANLQPARCLLIPLNFFLASAIDYPCIFDIDFRT